MIDIDYSNEQSYSQIENEYKIKKDDQGNFVFEKRNLKKKEE